MLICGNCHLILVCQCGAFTKVHNVLILIDIHSPLRNLLTIYSCVIMCNTHTLGYGSYSTFNQLSDLNSVLLLKVHRHQKHPNTLIVH